MSRVLKWRILISDGLAPEGLTLLGAEAEVMETGTLAELPTADALIVRGRTKVSAEVLATGEPRLKVVGRAGVGLDNIDLDAARRHDVIVVHAPQAATVAVAELTLGLILSLARQIPQADAGMRRGEWRKGELTGTLLLGKSLGVIGFGRIGTALAERAAGLGMRILGYDPHQAAEDMRARGVEPASLETLLGEADYISLHVPLTEETRGLIGPESLRYVKPGARLISTARGGVVDEEAVLAALESGQLAGAALDVFTVEPPGRTPLVQHPQVITTPHLGAQTLETQRQAAVDIASEVLAALRGEALRWRVA